MTVRIENGFIVAAGRMRSKCIAGRPNFKGDTSLQFV
jgi:hypothetical protein